MKAVSLPRQQEGAALSGIDECLLCERIVILAHRLSCDDAFRKDNTRVAFVGRSRMIQQGVFTSAGGPYDKY